MLDFTDRIGELAAVGSSPDGTVTARLSGPGRLRVDIDPGGLGRHGERSLAEAVTAAVRDAQTCYRKVLRDMLRTEPDFIEPDEAVLPRPEVSDVDTTSLSPAGCVNARWHEDGGAEVRYRPGTLSRRGVSAGFLSEETTHALTAARARFGERLTAALLADVGE